MVRFVLALLAVVGLLTSPLTAAAAQAACDQNQAMAQTSMPTMAGMDQGAAKSSVQPCCDLAGKSKTKTMNCPQACAVMCGVVVTLPYTVEIVVPLATPAAGFYAKLTALAPFEPSQLKRPPRSIL